MTNFSRYFLFLVFLTSLAWAQDTPCNSPDCTTNVPRESDTKTAGDNSSPAGSVENDTQRPTVINEGLRKDQPPPTERRPEPALCPGPQCPQLPPEEKTEFQKFVFTTTGERLSIYGRNLFEHVPSTFAPVDRIPVPSDYVLGPGDEVLIRAWGQIDINARVVVDRNGQIYLPRVGATNVAGIRYDQLTGYLKNAISRVFKNFDLNVSLGQLRSIQIFVVGQARRPGSYTVSSLSTLVNALFSSGGPSANGSMRNIQLKRHGAVISEFDVYDLLAKGDKSKDAPLLPGDVIYIPPVGQQIALMGSVNLPGIYEISDQGTTIGDQIGVAGGLSTTADGTHVIVERIENRSTRAVQEMKLDNAGLNQKLQDGDIVHVFPISPRVDGAITLRGSVALPGRYPWREGMHISDLIPSRDAVLTRDYWMRQTGLGRSQSGWINPVPQARMGKEKDSSQDKSVVEDSLASSTEPPYVRDEAISEDGQRGSNTRSDRSAEARRLKDNGWSDGPLQMSKTQIMRNQAEVNWDYAVIQRMNKQDLSSELVTFNLGNAISDPSSKDNLQLDAGDVITIFSQYDVSVPVEKRTKFILVEGEVKAPGVYRVKANETLRDAVARAGGLTPEAYLFASDFRRESTRIEQQEQYEQMINDMERDVRTKNRMLAASFTPEDRLAGQQELEAERSFIERLRRVQPTGRIVLQLNPSDAQVTALPEVQLEDGDKITIPAKPATVGVVGAVYSPNSFLFREGNTVKTYLNQSGGGTRNADGGRLFVVRSNGSVVSTQMRRSIWSGSFESTPLYPGDAVVMPEKIKTGSVLKGLRDWSQVFAQFALGVAALKTIAP